MLCSLAGGTNRSIIKNITAALNSFLNKYIRRLKTYWYFVKCNVTNDKYMRKNKKVLKDIGNVVWRYLKVTIQTNASNKYKTHWVSKTHYGFNAFYQVRN